VLAMTTPSGRPVPYLARWHGPGRRVFLDDYACSQCAIDLYESCFDATYSARRSSWWTGSSLSFWQDGLYFTPWAARRRCTGRGARTRRLAFRHLDRACSPSSGTS